MVSLRERQCDDRVSNRSGNTGLNDGPVLSNRQLNTNDFGAARMVHFPLRELALDTTQDSRADAILLPNRAILGFTKPRP